ncbi:MAG TPA: A24 family peptidase, partial [Candidatus Nanoarchaeia archaeon]|nr:A24 family peptidase [Candidatus Nanoarchaeia archaeon]
MIDLILIILTLITLTVSSITDFKRREVPDWISHGFVAGALGIRLLFSILNNDYSLFTTGVLGAGIFFGISYVAYYLGQWGGGDVKIAAGMGAVLGFSQLSFLFVILLLFAGAIYGIFYSMTLAIIHRKEFSRTFKRLYVQHRKYVVA